MHIPAHDDLLNVTRARELFSFLKLPFTWRDEIKRLKQNPCRGEGMLSSFQQISPRLSRNFRFRNFGVTYIHVSLPAENIIWEISQSLRGEAFIWCQMQWRRRGAGKNNGGAQGKLKVSPLIPWSVYGLSLSVQKYTVSNRSWGNGNECVSISRRSCDVYE